MRTTRKYSRKSLRSKSFEYISPNLCLFILLLFWNMPIQCQRPQLVLPIGHTAWVICSQFSHDNRFLATGSPDNTIKYWDIKSGKLIYSFEIQELLLSNDTFNKIWFSEDDKYLFSESEMGMRSVWDLKNGNLIHYFKDYEDKSIRCIYSNSGKYGLMEYDNDTLKFWDIEHQRPLNGYIFNELLNGQSFEKWKFSPDDKYVFGINGNIGRLFEVPTGTLLCTIEEDTAWIQSFSFSPDSKYLTTGNRDYTAKIWKLPSGNLAHILSGHTGVISNIEYSKDGKFILTTVGFNYLLNSIPDYSIKRWDAVSGELINSYEGHKDEVETIKFSPDGNYLLSTSHDKTARVWKTSTGKLLYSLALDDVVYECQFSDDQQYISTSGISDNCTKIWDAKTGKLLHILGGSGFSLMDVRISHDGKHFLASSFGNWGKIIEIINGKTLYTFSNPEGGFRTVEFSPDDSLILTENHYNAFVNIREKVTGTILYHLPEASYLFSNAYMCSKFSPDGKVIITENLDYQTSDGSKCHSTNIWNSKDGNLLYKLDDDPCIDSMYSCAFSKDSKFLVTCYYSRYLKLWDVSNGLNLQRFPYFLHCCTSPFCFSPKNKYFAYSVQPEQFIVYQIGDTQPLFLYRGILDGIRPEEFSPDDHYLLTVDNNNKINIWDLPLKVIVKTYSNSISKVNVAVFSQDGKSVIIGYVDGSLKIWDITKDKVPDSTTKFQEGIKDIMLSPDGKYALILLGLEQITEIVKLRLEDRKISEPLIVKGHLEQISFQNDLITSIYNAQVTFYRISTWKELLSYIFVGSNDWVVTHPSGLFDASEGAMDSMYFVKNKEIIELSQLKNKYWEPGLWQEIMSGKSLREVKNFNDLRMSPEIELGDIDSATGQLPIKLRERDGGIGPIKLLINNKEVIGDIRNGINWDGLGTIELSIDLREYKDYLEPGKENDISVITSSVEGTPIVEKIIHYIPPPDSLALESDLYGIFIGVNEYSGSSIRPLSFAVNDAKIMSESIKLGAQKFLNKNGKEQRVHIYSLFSDDDQKNLDPTKANIDSILNEISKKAKASDIVIMFMAGHGLSFRNYSGESYCFFTKDAESYNLSDSVALRVQAITTQELRNYFSRIHARKQILIIDACESGQLGEEITGNIRSENIDAVKTIALDKLKSQTGFFILTGSSKNQPSYESYIYGHGLLTYGILLGLKGPALEDNYYADVSKLFNFCKKEVPGFATRVKGVQTPQTFNPRGESFYFGEFTDNEKNEIILNEPKKILNRSIFINEISRMDDLKIGSLLNHKLQNMNTDPSGSIAFYDTDEFPDAIKVSGTYHILKNNNIKAKVVISKEDKIITMKNILARSKDDLIIQITNLIENY